MVKETVLDDVRWFGRKEGRLLLEEAEQRLSENPLAATHHMKTLRPNPVAQRELRLFGKYRVLYNVDADTAEVTILLIGEKRGDALFVQGEEFVAHEGDTAE